jgi:hypothetical protein
MMSLKGGERRDTVGKAFKKQNQQDYAASQELDERSVSKCVFQPNPSICILLMENARSSSTMQQQ